MGLDTTHNCWHGGYMRFNRFRYALARQIGIDLNDYIGYGSKGFKDLESIEHDLNPLFNHSDCDGELNPLEAEKIANGLDSILETLKSDELADENFKDQITQFRDGCRLAVSKGETIEFC